MPRGFQEHSFVKHLVSGAYGFILRDLDWHYLVLPTRNRDAFDADVIWGFERIVYADRDPTDEERALLTAYILTH